MHRLRNLLNRNSNVYHTVLVSSVVKQVGELDWLISVNSNITLAQTILRSDTDII